MTQYARDERHALADLMLELGPDEPTLCTGWTTRDLAAHLVVRDRRPDATAGVLIAALADHGERVRQSVAARAYPGIIDEVRRPPWWSLVSNPVMHELGNAAEFFIHHEDVRRARPGWQPRALPTGQQKVIWGAARLSARLGLRKLHLPVLVQAPGYGEMQIGTGTPQASLIGEPGELAMFLSGRQRAARVQVDAAPAVAERLRTANLGA